jgi:transcriptional regulator with XRE-family HTH domain
MDVVAVPNPEHRPDRVEPSAASLIGERIRAIRRAHSLTLVQLAARSGLSQPFLSQVETGRARPSFASVDRIARALGTTQIELFAALADAPPSNSPSEQADDYQSLGSSGPFAEGSVRVMAPAAQSFSPVEFTSRNQDFGEYFIHDEEEFVYVIDGPIDVDLGTRTFRGVTGDSFFSPPRTPHRWRSPDGGKYRVLVVKQRLQPDDAPRVSSEHITELARHL